MDMKIINEQEAPLLERKNITFELEYSDKSTPSRSQLRDMLANKLKVDAKAIGIKSIEQVYGERKTIVKTEIYKSQEALEKVNTKKIVTKLQKDLAKKAEADKKAAEEAAAKKEAEAAAPPAEEKKKAPAEKKKEEPADEEKKE